MHDNSVHCYCSSHSIQIILAENIIKNYDFLNLKVFKKII